MKNQQGDELAGRVALGALLLGALFALPGCKTVERVIEDPSRLCPPNHVLTADGCVLRPPAISTASPTPDPHECVCGLVAPLPAGCEGRQSSYTDPYCRCVPPCYSPSPEPLPTATPAPTPVNPGPLPTPTVAPEPTATPAPTASPTPAPTPGWPSCVDGEWLGDPTCDGCCASGDVCRPKLGADSPLYACHPKPAPTPTPKPTPDPCVKGSVEVMQYQLRQGHLTLLAGSSPPLAYNDNAEGTKRDCILMATGDRVECDPPHRVMTPGSVWWGVECFPPAPPPVVTPTPTPGPTPTLGAYGCGGVPVARVGIKISKAPASKPSCRWSPETGIAEGDCVLVADASVRGPKGSQADIPSGEAHLGWLPGCWWVVRPAWQQESQPDMELDLGVRHWMAPPDQATSLASWDVTEPPYGAQPFGSLARWQYDAAFKGSRSRLRTCWPPDVPDPVCSDWVTVEHR